jgi:hypothetical protein
LRCFSVCFSLFLSYSYLPFYPSKNFN